MAITYTDNLKLRVPDIGELNWGDEVNENTQLLSTFMSGQIQDNYVLDGLLASAGSGLTVNYAGGSCVVNGATYQFDAGTKTATAAGAAGERKLNYLYVNSSGTMAISTTAPTGDFCLLALIDTNTTTIDRVGDFRGVQRRNIIDEFKARHRGTFVDVFVYDTRLDSDGGAWRKRCQHTSWYNETLNTATRGATKEFPAVAVLGLESDALTIYDATRPDCPMWMVFDRGDNADSKSTATGNLVNGGSSQSAAMVNGVLVVGNSATGSANTPDGVDVISFVGDSGKAYSTALSRSGIWGGGILDRNGLSGGWAANNPSFITNNTTNAVAMVVLPNAPTDPVTQLPVPTVAIGTDGGLSVIQDDGTVQSAGVGSAKVHQVAYRDRYLYLGRSSGSGESSSRFMEVYPADDAPTALNDSAQYVVKLSETGIPALLGNGDVMGPVTWGGASGLSLLALDYTTAANSLISYITNDYNTGWLVGDIRRAILTNSKTADRSYKASTMVENGTVTETTAAGALSTYSGFSTANYLSQPYSADLDFGTGDFCVMCWVKGAANTAAETVINRDSSTTAQRILLQIDAAGTVSFTVDDNTTVRTATSAQVVDNNVYHFLCGVYSAGAVTIYIDGIQAGQTTGAALLTMSNAAGLLRVGLDAQGANPLTNGTTALIRLSATAPSVNQIAKIYDDEKHLFESGATCLLAGTSNAVTALSVDRVTQEVHAATSYGRSTFKGLRRVGAEATDVGTPAATAAAGGVLAQAGSTALRIAAPEINLTSERAGIVDHAGQQQTFSFTFGSADTDAALGIGWFPVSVFYGGSLKALTTDYTIDFDGFRYTVVFGSAPGAGTVQVVARRMN